ncbi:hypothetical protein GTR04_5496 [Trichophyton interdigitale]|uniref:Uncharacterized protein n=2 Tax=Trichophyton interdigitale TaxID=101480 RepID=A0A9P4YJ80_9EURO|nr:hypothetical protein H101_06449 [Trichophyton interdigitale H6]KAF3897134.1 hypothetical protein GY632_2437 [Trichophyton interdigitale]KAG5210837.1 hypothetical protein GY631_5090 [Trichophyton interdigitale]KAG8207112.1 hypothetical protein GTR04_5496 [Trichophyton interdigitale]KDB20762.1 hypothetical protein H109_07288 [Trichophyton interdigitale MR816]
MGHSITWEYSEESEAEEMVSRCSYCGRFCNKRAIHGKTGLCYPCRETLRKEGDKRALETDSDTESASSGRGAEECEPVKGHPAATAEAEDDSQSAKSEEGTACSNVCSRCWAAEATGTLYNSPVCDDCYHLAQANREWMKGTKKRFQPPNPHLQAGKRLTRVCDSCRQKRKRCEHRRVVDATDPEAHCRKRGRKRKCEEISDDKKESENNKAPTSREEEQAEIIVVDDPAEEPGCSDESMNHAIKESLDTVYKRELLKLEVIANEKVNEANKALDAVRDHLRSWLDHVRRGNSLGKQQLPEQQPEKPEQPEQLDPLEQQDQLPQLLQPPKPAAQEECV